MTIIGNDDDVTIWQIVITKTLQNVSLDELLSRAFESRSEIFVSSSFSPPLSQNLYNSLISGTCDEDLKVDDLCATI